MAVNTGRAGARRVWVAGQAYDPLTLAAATAWIRSALAAGTGGQIRVVDTTDHVAAGPDQVGQEGLILTGSRPVVISGRLAGGRLPQRIDAHALAGALLAAAARGSWRTYLLGGAASGASGTVTIPCGAIRAAGALRLLHPGLMLAGAASIDGAGTTIDAIAAARPDLVLIDLDYDVAASRWLHGLREALPGAWLYPCPGFIDWHAGDPIRRRARQLRRVAVLAGCARLLAGAVRSRILARRPLDPHGITHG